MDAIFGLPPQSPLAEAFSEDWSLLPLRVPMGWNVVYNTLMARRLPDGRVEVNDSEDLYWARTARPPWLTEQEAVRKGGLQAREISIDAGWYYGCGFRIVVLDPDWDHEGASFTTSDLEEFVATLEGWMRMITERGELPKV
ncbi:hypothetical protein [Streptomyces deccanensis]|uniref:hypothetical protein n=1 Tax=Streptomyces deccanensis TaxID=424188 RepID=UPI001EFB9FB5|nr:hypothetical protein [Streptomyces deccanensis]ULR53080.1 hypothetical protein L3078_29505 [Streptomyces deccanensis]